MSIIVWSIIVIIFNIMDSVTTELAFRQYPDSTLRSEGNPLMRILMLKNRFISEVVKQIGVLSLVIWLFNLKDINSIRFVAICFAIVVMNNSFIVISRSICKRKVISPMGKLQSMYHIPNIFIYPVAMFIIFVLGIDLSLLFK